MPNSDRPFELMFLQYVCHGWQPRNIAVLLLDKEADVLSVRFTSNWEGFEGIDLEIASALAEDLLVKVQELGASMLVSYLQTTLSNTLRITEPEPFRTDDVTRELDAFEQQLIRSDTPIETIARVKKPIPTRNETFQIRKIRAWSYDLLRLGPTRHHLSLSDAVYATAGAGAVVLALTASVSTFHSNRSAAITANVPGIEAIVLDAPADLPCRPVLMPVRLTRADLQLRMRARRSSTPPVEDIKEVPRFSAPKQISELPEVSLLMPEDFPALQVETTWPYTAEETELPFPSPADPPKRMAKILQAFAAPFRKIGHVLSE